MRCWSCQSIIVLPDLINGKPGEAGTIRAGGAEPVTPPFTYEHRFVCPRCGSVYDQVTTITTDRVVSQEAEKLSEEAQERKRLWKE